MKIVYIATVRFPTEKVHGAAIAKMCEAFIKKGASLEFLVPKRTQSFNLKNKDWRRFYNIKKGFKVKKLWCLDILAPLGESFSFLKPFSFLLLNFSFHFSLFFYFIKKEAEIVYTREVLPIPLLLLFKKRIFVELHDWPSGKPANCFYKLFLKKAQGIICISPFLVKKAKRVKTPKKIFLSPSAVGQEFFRKLKKKTARKKLKLPINKKIIAYSGKLTKEKGLKTLLAAAKRVSKKKDILFLLIGSSFIAGEDKEISKIAKKTKNILYLGYKPYNKIPFYLKAADILVLPNSGKTEEKIYKKYTSPVKLYEYLASGKPVIASKIPALEKTVEEKRQVLFFKPDNSKELAEKILTVLEDKKLARFLAERGRNFALKHTWDKRSQKVLKFMKHHLGIFIAKIIYVF